MMNPRIPRKSDPTGVSMGQRRALELLDAAIAALDEDALRERLARRLTPARASLSILALRQPAALTER